MAMQRLDGRFIYAASDLNAYLECRRLTELEMLVARGRLERPDTDDPHAELLRRKGDEHERAHLELLQRRHGDGVVTFESPERSIEAYERAERETLAAMRAGVPVIYQATFFDGRFYGRADFLRRVSEASNLGDYGYEIVDTKLGLQPKPYYLVQLCNYSEHLERLQGRMPTWGHVVLGSGEERRFRLHDYLAYYRRVKARFLEFVSEFAAIEDPREYPFERSHCAICPWNGACEQKRRDDDHLSLVAGIRRDQIAKLEEAGICRVSELAQAGVRRPHGMGDEIFTKLRRQAALQIAGRAGTRPIHEVLPRDPGLGFELLPAPAAGDVFFDMEGDPLYEPGRGLEYLFGCWMPDDQPQYLAFWGRDRTAEKRAFEEFVDFITERRRRYPAMHVYHYASYEKSALRRLAQQHCTRENEVDELLRGEVLVDLFAVVRGSLMISEERYGLKNLERFYDLQRETIVKKGDESIVRFERWLLERDEKILNDIESYNRDDCRSAHGLREWLLERRIEAMAKFGDDRPWRDAKVPKEEKPDAEDLRRTDLERELLANVVLPQTEQEYREMAADRRSRYLLANLMAYHRREEKPAWWAYYDRCENVDRLFEFDRDSIAELRLRVDVEPWPDKQSLVYTYVFPEQLHKLGAGDSVHNPRTRKQAGTIARIDDDANILELKTSATLDAAQTITELIPSGPPPPKAQRGALTRIGPSFLNGTLAHEYPATAGLLENRDPVLRHPRDRVVQPEHITAETVSAVASALDNSYLFIQGPPGSGKSTIGSHVICDLLQHGKRVAVTGMSHKAIHNLLHKVEQCTHERNGSFRGRYKHSGNGSEYRSELASPFIESVNSNKSFDGDDYQLAGGTGFLLAREELAGRFDYLFIDEAGQVSLADALAMSLCAKNVVLLGDPSQLAQVSQGRHPLHADDSVLQHLLGDEQTVPERFGIFLGVSYRMQPKICEFISRAMYENRLRPADSTVMHRVVMPDGDLAGLYFLPIEHDGNASSSVEEANAIVSWISALRTHGQVIDSRPPVRDVIVVTPYNAQRRLISEKLRQAAIDDVQVGTVDKFQGQEAAIVFYSMATSSGEDVPRGVEFLFERNRFNVAISRARAASMLVCSPRLLDVACRNPAQMALVNLLCAFVEKAEELPLAREWMREAESL